MFGQKPETPIHPLDTEHVGVIIAETVMHLLDEELGVAKGGQMVALGTGDGASIFVAEQGLEWTFEHSIPSQKPYHIRVVSIHVGRR